MTLLSSICSPGVPLACSRVWTTSSSLFSSSAGMQYLQCLETRAEQSLDKDPLPGEHVRAPPCTSPLRQQSKHRLQGVGRGVVSGDQHPTFQGHTAASA